MDVGGGEGSLLRSILAAHPQLRGVLFEMPGVVDLARTALVGAPEIDRCELVAGDFFTAIPGRSSLLLLKKGHPRLDRRARSDDLAQLPGDGCCWWRTSSLRATSPRSASGSMC
jgi:hypothetical protein